MDTAGRRPDSALLDDDQRLLILLRSGDEAAFVALVKRYHRPLVRLALRVVKREDLAEEVAQEAWQGLLESLDRFTPQASLKTWLYRILINCARARARKERHSVPLSSLGSDDPDAPTVSPERFSPQGHVWSGSRSGAGSMQRRALAAVCAICLKYVMHQVHACRWSSNRARSPDDMTPGVM